MKRDKIIESAVVYSTKDSEKIAKINQWITDSNRDKSVVTHGIGLSFFDLISFLQFDKEQVYLVVSSDENKRAAGIVFLGEGGTPLFFGSLGGVLAKSVHNFEDVAFSVGEKQTWCVGEICENSKLGESAEDIEIESFLRAFLLFFHI